MALRTSSWGSEAYFIFLHRPILFFSIRSFVWLPLWWLAVAGQQYRSAPLSRYCRALPASENLWLKIRGLVVALPRQVLSDVAPSVLGQNFDPDFTGEVAENTSRTTDAHRFYTDTVGRLSSFICVHLRSSVLKIRGLVAFVVNQISAHSRSFAGNSPSAFRVLSDVASLGTRATGPFPLFQTIGMFNRRWRRLTQIRNLNPQTVNP